MGKISYTELDKLIINNPKIPTKQAKMFLLEYIISMTFVFCYPGFKGMLNKKFDTKKINVEDDNSINKIELDGKFVDEVTTLILESYGYGKGTA